MLSRKKKCNTNLIGLQSAPYLVATGMLQGRSRSFSNLGGAEGGALFLGL